MNPEGLMYQVVGRVDEINRVSSRLIESNYQAFEPASLEMPRLEPAELGFLRSVSWLFVMYYEVGKVGVGFLASRLSAYGLDPNGKLEGHRRLVQQLRTFLQHNLNPRKRHDRTIQEACELWLREQCGTAVPGTNGHWEKCLQGLLKEAHEFLGGLLEALRGIEGDESRDEICRDWQFRIQRYHPPEAFDGLILKVANDMGRENIDPARLRVAFYEKWNQELALLAAGYEFEIEARKLVEHALLTATTPALPITGRDIMDTFNISPGPQVGELLARARQIYDSEPCSRETLLIRLRQGMT